jgi:multidrug transporter EmrE-like cation transporter
MIYLVLAILASFSITLLIKDNETRGVKTQVVLAANYLTAALIGGAFLIFGGIPPMSRETLFLGLGGGLLWPGAFFLLMWGIRHFGVSLAGAVSRLSLTVPLIFAVVFLDERLEVGMVLGIVAALAACVLLSSIGSERQGSKTQLSERLDRRAVWYFPALLLIFGLVDVWANLFTTVAPTEEKPLFMLLIFSGAAITMAVVIAWQRLEIDRRSALRGLVLGVPNFFSTYFLVESLGAPAFNGMSAVVYTLYSVVGVVLAYLAGALIWEERLTRRNQAGVALAVVAIVLLNLR